MAASGRRTLVRAAKDIARFTLDTRLWRPRHARLLLGYAAERQQRCTDIGTDAEHMHAAAGWLAAAQDAMPDHGIAGRYSLTTGWTSSYPETTGYLIPTLLALAGEPGLVQFEARAKRAVDFLLALQLPSGAFPAGEVHENVTNPSIFNSAQILTGLIAWHAHSGEQRVLDAAVRAGDWLVSMQDSDGVWRRAVYNDLPAAYMAHASCWLAELGVYTSMQGYLDSAAAHFRWVRTLINPETRAFSLAGFEAIQHERRVAYTHSIAYTLFGVQMMAEILGDAGGETDVENAAAAIAGRLETLGWLPGMLNWQWEGHVNYSCVTGDAQMALIWMRIFERRGQRRFANAAFRAIDLVKGAQAMRERAPALHGAVPGSDPPWGDYVRHAYPNWAAKFFIDALFAKRRVLALLEQRTAQESSQNVAGTQLNYEG